MRVRVGLSRQENPERFARGHRSPAEPVLPCDLPFASSSVRVASKIETNARSDTPEDSAFAAPFLKGRVSSYVVSAAHSFLPRVTPDFLRKTVGAEYVRQTRSAHPVFT